MVQRAILRLKQPNLDGIGAQLHRIIAAYAIAKKLRIPFQYDSITQYDNAIFDANRRALPEWNDLIKHFVPRFLEDSQQNREVIVHRNQRLGPVCFKVVKSLFNQSRTAHIIDSPHTITNRYPSFLDALDFSEAFNSYKGNLRSRDSLQIVLHLRRGELGLSQFKERFLPLGYYENILSQFIPKFEQFGIPFEIIVPVEPGQEKLLSIDDPKIAHSLRMDPDNPNLVRVTKNKFRLHYEEPNPLDTPLLMKAKWIVSGDAWTDFLLFLNADIFIMSKSSLSYVAAMLNRHKQVIYPHFWHPRLSSWISSSDIRRMRNLVSQATTNRI